MQEGRLILEDPCYRHGKDKVQGKEGYTERRREVFLPILEALDIKRHRYFRDIRMKLAESALVMSYRGASREFETAMGIHVPKRTIHRFVKEIGLGFWRQTRQLRSFEY